MILSGQEKYRIVAIEMLLISLIENIDTFETSTLWVKLANIRQQSNRLKDSILKHSKEFYGDAADEVSGQAVAGSAIFDRLMIAALASVELSEEKQDEFSKEINELLTKFEL
jgi:hypothetical protein